MGSRILFYCTVCSVASQLAAVSAYGASRFSLMPARPVADGGVLSSVEESLGLPRTGWAIGTQLDYSARPLIGTPVGGGGKVDIVHRSLTQHLFGGLGISDRLTLVADLPTTWHHRYTDPDTANAPVTSREALGDLRFGLKLRLLDRRRLPIGLALMPFVTLPTATTEIFLGDTDVTAGGQLILDGTLGSHVVWSTNAGLTVRPRLQAVGLDFDDQLTLAGGVGVHVAKWLAVTGAVLSRTPLAHPYRAANTSPTEGRAGLHWTLGHHQRVHLHTGAGLGFQYGNAAPRYRLLAGLTFLSSPHR